MLLLLVLLLLLHLERESAHTVPADVGGRVFGAAAMTRHKRLRLCVNYLTSRKLSIFNSFVIESVTALRAQGVTRCQQDPPAPFQGPGTERHHDPRQLQTRGYHSPFPKTLVNSFKSWPKTMSEYAKKCFFPRLVDTFPFCMMKMVRKMSSIRKFRDDIV